MALVTLSEVYSALPVWPGALFDTGPGVKITAQTATSFAWRFVDGTPLEGFSITATGTGFAYDGARPTEGTLAALTIRDTAGQPVLTVSQIAPASLASDLALLMAQAFGWDDPNGGAGPRVKNAWSLLLSGNDSVTGTAGNDGWGLVGVDAGNDRISTGAGDDWINGGSGRDTIDGGAGWDVLNYAETHWEEGIPMVRGLAVNVSKGTVADPFGFVDRFTGIEAVHGSAARDRFIGGAEGMNFMGCRGADTLIGGASGADWAVYQDDVWMGGGAGIVARLQVSAVAGDVFGTIRDGFGTLDRLTNINNVQGTRFADTFIGSDRDNIFVGGEGKDSFDGGGGSDTIWLFRGFVAAPQGGISVDLTLTSGQVRNDGFGNAETLHGIENVVGSRNGDRIKGSSGANGIEGLGGADTLTGAGGQDHFLFLHDFAFGTASIITDFHSGAGSDQDVLVIAVSDLGFSTDLLLDIGPRATTGASSFVFNPLTRVLAWDQDGTGAGAALALATLVGVNALTAANFELI